jgi:isopenicillin-N N-acyltransferase-like protein
MPKIYEFSGTHRAVGRAHGEELREALRDSLDQRMSRCIAASRSAGEELDVDGIRRLVGECLVHVREFSPGLGEELESIAEGADVPVEDVLLVSGYTDIRDAVARAAGGDAFECTACWAGPGATADGATYVAQTWDMYAEAESGAAWMKLAVEGQPAVFALSYAGCVGMMGMNSRGVAVAANNLSPLDARPGVPWTVLCRAILASASAEEAYATMRRARLCSGHNFLIGDSTGAGFSVETTGERLARIDPEVPVYAHSNHYLDPGLSELEKPLNPKGSTRQRRERMAEILQEGRGQIDREFLRNALSDHRNSPLSICVHDYEATEGKPVRSCGALVMNATEREVDFVTGNPCRGEFSTVSLGD